MNGVCIDKNLSTFVFLLEKKDCLVLQVSYSVTAYERNLQYIDLGFYFLEKSEVGFTHSRNLISKQQKQYKKSGVKYSLISVSVLK